MVDNKKDIKCPACNKEMSKIYIPELKINIDICLIGCGGIYFDNREFYHFDEQHENIDEILEKIKDKNFEPVEQNQVRICPVCGANMVKNYASIRKEVQVDECYSCGGKFLDNGELEKIRAQYKTETDRSFDAIKALYDSVGEELKVKEAEWEELRKTRSHIKQIYDRVFDYLWKKFS